jgi:hypothetical protein
MKHRKRRIAWSVGWRIVAVLLVVLWVRSYWRSDIAFGYAYQQTSLSISSIRGELLIETIESPLIIGWSFHSAPSESIVDPSFWAMTHFGFGILDRQPLGRMYVLPHASLLILFAAFTVAPWLPWHFTLRTLLIATTLVAVGLGVVAWSMG